MDLDMKCCITLVWTTSEMGQWTWVLIIVLKVTSWFLVVLLQRKDDIRKKERNMKGHGNINSDANKH